MSETSNTPYHNSMSDGGKYRVKKRKQKVYLNIIDRDRGYEDDTDYGYAYDNAVYDGVSKSDPFGMYTGVPENPYDTPVQDADDL